MLCAWIAPSGQPGFGGGPRPSQAASDVVQTAMLCRVPTRLIDAYFDALNGERWESIGGLFASDATLHAPGTDPKIGNGEISLYFAALLAPYIEHRHEVTRRHESGDVVTVEVHVRAQLANGESVEFDAVEIFDVTAASISRVRRLYDSQQLRRDLAQALAASPPRVGLNDGSLSQLTTARLRAALSLVRRGEVFRLGTSPPAKWHLPPVAPLGMGKRLMNGVCARSIVLDIGADLGDSTSGLLLGAADLVSAADERAIEIRQGDVIVLRTGSANADGGALLGNREMLEWLTAVGPSAVCTDREAVFRGLDGADAAADRACRDELGLLVGTRWSLDHLCADCLQDDVWEGLLVSLPDTQSAPDHYAAHAVVIK